ncbi:MAG: PAS domain-containing hybrid sensor histidine kinase/response regulator [Planctomycetota bacterium]|jgi:PAS domain S-box-containing protein
MSGGGHQLPDDAQRVVRPLLEALGTGAAVLDASGVVQAANGAWLEGGPGAHGLDTTVGGNLLQALEASGTPPAAELAAGLRTVLGQGAAAYQQAVQSGERWDYCTVRALALDGRPHALLTLEESTERQQARQALARSREELRRYREHLEELIADRTTSLRAAEQKFRKLTEQTTAGIMINRGRECLYANAGVTAICGYTEAELRDRSLWDLVRADHRTIVADRSEARLRGEPVAATFEVPIIAKDGSERWAEMSAAFVEYEGGPASIVTCFDITDRKRLERQMLHTQKLESLGVLAGGIAHDFNNLLVSMLGNASLALEELPPDSAAQYSVAQIEKAAVRASELTNQLLAYAGKGTLRREPTDLAALVTEMGQLLETAVGRRGTIALGCDPTAPAIEADPGQLRQVVMNLITNAADALGDGGGTISIRTGVASYAGADPDPEGRWIAAPPAPGRYVFLEVADSGAGMDDSTRARIFDPFFTTKVTGHGLGLAAVLGIVRGHDGHVAVSSSNGTGTTVRVVIPLTGAPAPSGAETPESAAGGWRGEGTVLVVDDEPEVIEVAVAMLKRRGFDVLTAGDGAEAVERLRGDAGGAVVLVLLDLTMPNLGGEEAFHALRAVRADVPIVISTGYHEHAFLERIQGDPHTGVLPKPYSASQLGRAVRDALANQ